VAYYPDLSSYSYYLRPQNPTAIERAYPNALNVGWLDRVAPFAQSETLPDETLLKRLLAHTVLSVLMLRGIHHCQFCPNVLTDTHRTLLIYRDREIVLDNGEVLVVGEDGLAFRAPVMLYHYVTEHRYCPPDVFWEALRTSSPILGFELEEAARVPAPDMNFEERRQTTVQQKRNFAELLLLSSQ
jgi:hypothetical protein